jgi:hypothetical protein
MDRSPTVAAESSQVRQAPGVRTRSGRPRAPARPGGADAPGTVARARVRHRHRALCVRWPARDHRRDRRSGRDREDPHPPPPAGACTAARTVSRAFALPRSLTGEQDVGSAAEPTALLGPRSRDGVGARLVNAAPGRCRACIVTVRGIASPARAESVDRSEHGGYATYAWKMSFEMPIRGKSRFCRAVLPHRPASTRVDPGQGAGPHQGRAWL